MGLYSPDCLEKLSDKSKPVLFIESHQGVERCEGALFGRLVSLRTRVEKALRLFIRQSLEAFFSETGGDGCFHRINKKTADLIVVASRYCSKAPLLSL